MIIFDIETPAVDDFAGLTDVHMVHCIVARLAHGQMLIGRSDIPDSIEKVLKAMQGQTVCGHNAVNFDVPALRKLYPWWKPSKVIDTMVMSACIYPDIMSSDWVKFRDMPKHLRGRHSLKAWGYRLGHLKDDYGEEQDAFEVVSDDLVSYCETDVDVTYSLYQHLMLQRPSKKMLMLEHAFAEIIRIQQKNGWPFDLKGAQRLAGEIAGKRETLRTQLQELFPPKEVPMKSQWWEDNDGNLYETLGEAKQAKVKRADLRKGPYKTKKIPFNPASRDQIAERLIANGWKPKAYEGKRPKIDEPTLIEIGSKEALLLKDYLLLTKRIGQIAEGRHAWIDHCRCGRIHGKVYTNGAVTGRCTHTSPNVAQVPAVRAVYGEECRSLWQAPKGKVLVGADASGIELRCLAHYLARYDNGAYADLVSDPDGDIHTANQKAAGLDTRDQAKTFIYAFLYGAGDGKIGQIVGGSSRHGKQLKANFKKKIPAFGHLVRAIENAVTGRGYLTGLDGRKLPCRSKHSALNLLLQSAGALLMKQALIHFVDMASHPYELHGNIHDEVQFSCKAEHADQLGQDFVNAIKKAGETFEFRCPLDGEYKQGQSWADTH